MKEYNREKKKWEEPTGEGKFKKRDTCKGGREHEYLPTLPSYVDVIGEITPEMILGYYALEEERYKFEQEENEKYQKLGLKLRRFYGKVHKYLICTGCGKRKYE